MKAVVCKQYGPPEQLRIEDVSPRPPGDGEVLIAVRAAGVNFPDTLIIEGKYQFKPDPPFTPGSEAAGVVKAVGPGVADFRPGDPVVALAPFGAYAEEIVASEIQLVKMPAHLDFERAASALTTYGTTQYALGDRAKLAAGETLLVLGAAGGVGLAAVEFGKVLGARVIAAASTAAKLEVAKQAGADAVIDYSKEDLRSRVKELTSGEGANVVYDPVGGAFTEAALRATAWNGRVLIIGFTAGEIPKIPTNLTLLKSASIIGVFWGAWLMREPKRAQAMHAEILAWIRDGKLRPRIFARHSLEDAPRALRDLIDRKVHGKAVLVVGTS
jgi:NADPH:quinone reductase